MYVADTQNNRIQKLSPTGHWLASWGDLPQLDRPIGVAVDAAGNIFALDPIHSNIVEYAPGGAVRATWGAQGVLPGQLMHPTSIAMDARGTIYVVDYDNNRIQKLVRTIQPH
jgi:sugar lactone lactonase YvrE